MKFLPLPGGSRTAPRVTGPVLVCLLMFALASVAQEVPKHACSKPAVPEQYKSPDAQDAFVMQADEFRRCIKKFTSKHQALSKTHAEAANAATREWNQFAADAIKIRPAGEQPEVPRP